MCFLFTLQADVGSYSSFKTATSFMYPVFAGRNYHALSFYLLIFCKYCTDFYLSPHRFFLTFLYWVSDLSSMLFFHVKYVSSSSTRLWNYHKIIVQSISYGRLLPNSLDNNLSTTINSNELSTDPWCMPFLILNLLPTVLLILTASARFY